MDRSAVVVQRDVPSTMRDGVILMADLYTPAGAGPWPALIQRTPYNKSAVLPPINVLDPVRACQEGFAVVIQDVRGRYRSGGEFYPFRHEELDGYDTVEWVAEQPWCDGHVGLYGRSYSGSTCWFAAVGNPPHLDAIAPIVTSSDHCEGWTYRQGALEQAFALIWTLRDLGIERALSGAFPMDEYVQLNARLPRILALPERPPWDEVARLGPWVRDWINHAYDDDYWGPWRIWPRLHSGTAPSLSISGWFDIFARGTIDLFNHLQRLPNAPGRHALIMGPWAHVNPLSQVVGDADFGIPAAPGVFDLAGKMLAWFKRWLVDPAAPAQPVVQYFSMGTNEWRSDQAWPPRPTTATWYLATDGAANSLAGGGLLVRHAPVETVTDRLIYHASDPVPTLGGACCPEYPANRPGAFDQSPIERRSDVLVYTSDPLSAPAVIAGSPTAAIYAAASAGELDLVVKLIDVAPDGSARNVADGIVRSQHVAPQTARPGELQLYIVDLGPTANVFAAGHRVRLDIALSSWPRFDLNPMAQNGAQQPIATGGGFPSHITLPIV